MPYDAIDAYQRCRGTRYSEVQANNFRPKASGGSLFFVSIITVYLKHV
jgi:hypothetical protein